MVFTEIFSPKFIWNRKHTPFNVNIFVRNSKSANKNDKLIERKKVNKMPTTCDVVFENNPMKVLYSGQLLRGTVRINMTGEKKVRGIFIEIDGIGYARWSRSAGKSRKFHTGNEIYLNERTYFVGGTSGTLIFWLFYFQLNATFFFSIFFARLIDRRSSCTARSISIRISVPFTTSIAKFVSREIWSHQIYGSS